MNTKDYEMIVAQHGNFTLVVTHSKVAKLETKAAVEGEKKEGEAEEKKKEEK